MDIQRPLTSWFRITGWSFFLAAALFFGVAFWYLPQLLGLDFLRPRLIEGLEKNFHCRVLMGNVSAELVPSPGLVVRHVVFLESSKAPHLLASVVSVHLGISIKPFLRDGKLGFNTIRFVRPRFIGHREKDPSGEAPWIFLALPQPESKTGGDVSWEIRNGSLEVWDHTQKPTKKWTFDHLSGSYHTQLEAGSLSGRAPVLGLSSAVDFHYDHSAPYPIQVNVSDADVSAVQSILPVQLPPQDGSLGFTVNARFQPSLEVRALTDPHSSKGVGSISVLAQRPQAAADWTWSITGKNFILSQTTFKFPEWSAQSDAEGLSVHVRATTQTGGTGEVLWKNPAESDDSDLNVTISSVTVHQILQIFQLQSTPKAGASWNPHGYEPWVITQGSMKSIFHPGSVMEVKEGLFQIAGMTLNIAGLFQTGQKPSAHLRGTLQNIPVDSIVESFFNPPAPLTGTGQLVFDWSFPLTEDWFRQVNGPCQVQVNKGVVKYLKTIYRIFSVLSLSNYLHFRLPQVTAQGIVFQSIAGHLMFKNGVLTSDDLFLKSNGMNMGLKGALDIPKERIDATLRLELFRFLEDVLKVVPVTHWLFKKSNKIFLPLLVQISGPWDNVDIR